MMFQFFGNFIVDWFVSLCGIRILRLYFLNKAYLSRPPWFFPMAATLVVWFASYYLEFRILQLLQPQGLLHPTI